MNFLFLITIIATWDFASNTDIHDAITASGQNGKTITLSSDVADINMYVDATSGVLELNHDKGQTGAPINSVHINSSTIMYVPIYRIGDQLTITTTLAETAGDNPTGTAYHPNTVTINGTTTTYTATSSDVQAQWLAIRATTDTYLETVQVQYLETTTPLLLGFAFNGEEYSASNVFTYNETDQTFYGTIAITKDPNYAPSDDNLPVVVDVEDGQQQSVTYNANDGTVEIIVTDGTANNTYILSFEDKPDYTVSYYYNDELQEIQTVEQDATIGYWAVEVGVEKKVTRGWYYASGQKATLDDVITASVDLYALINDEEVATGDSSWDYDLTQPYFYPEDHELIDITGAYSSTTHGFNVQDLTVEVSKDAFIILGMCSNTTGTITVTIDGVEVEQIDASFADGTTYTYHYQATHPGKVTFTFASETGYLHYVHLRNIATLDIDEVTQNGEDFYWILPATEESDRTELLRTIVEIVNTLTDDGTRVVVFLPDGTYDLGSECLPAITRANVSIVGQSMEKTIIKNNINYSTSKENALLLNNSTGLYLQDLTLENDYPYYEKSSDRRGVCFQDKGAQTICKNIRMLSYQNTYYTTNDEEQYFETCDIHGTLDFILGSGTAYFNNCTIFVEGRKEYGVGSSSEAVITSPNTAENRSYGFVFNDCTVTGVAGQTYSFGRAWSNTARCVWIDTQLDEALTLTDSRWYLAGTSTNIVPCLFAEYGTTPASTRVTATFNGTLKTILLAEYADDEQYTVQYYDYNNIFDTFDPQNQTLQVELSDLRAEVGSTEVSFAGTTDATLYAIFLNGTFVAFTENTTYTLPRAITEEDSVEVRGCNQNGGLGTAITYVKEETEETEEAIANISSAPEVLFIEYFDLAGRKVSAPERGISIEVVHYTDGTTEEKKILKH